jgi:hypothetical protein
MISSRFAALLAVLLAPAAAARAAEALSSDAPFDARVESGRAWKEKLGFTAVQAQKYMAAQKEKEDALRPLRGQMRDEVQKLQEQVVSKASQSDIGATLERVARVRELIGAAERGFDAGLASFLSPIQRAKMLLGTPVESAGSEAGSVRAAAAVDEEEPE